MKTNSEIVTKALMRGIAVELEGHVYRFFRSGEEVPIPHGEMGTAEQPWLGIQMEQDQKAVFCGAELSFADVIRMAEQLPKDKVAQIAMQLTLLEEKAR